MRVKGILRLSILAVCGAATAVTAVADQATITGRVVVTKALTKKRVTMPSYQLRGASVDPREQETSRKDLPVIDELSRVVIYLEGAGLDPATPTKDVTLTQRNQQLRPGDRRYIGGFDCLLSKRGSHLSQHIFVVKGQAVRPRLLRRGSDAVLSRSTDRESLKSIVTCMPI